MRFLSHIQTAGVAVAFLIAPLTAARANLLTDTGFETTQLSSGAYDYERSTLNGWTYAGNAVLINTGAGSPWIAASQTGYGGDQVAGVQTTGSISQTFVAGYTGNYLVSWLDAGRQGTGGGNQTYIAKLFDNTTGLTDGTETLNTTAGSNFNAESFSALLTAGDSLTLSFTGQDTSDNTALIDNVSVVPEPGTLILFGAGLAGLGWIRRRNAI